MNGEALARLRAICLALPEAVETGGVGNPSFKVREKIFAMRHEMEGRMSLWCKDAARPAGGARARRSRTLLRTALCRPARLDRRVSGRGADWEEIAGLVEDSYRRTAPKRLVAI